MTAVRFLLALLLLAASVCQAYVPKATKNANKPVLAELKQASMGAFAALTIAGSAMLAPNAHAMALPPAFSSSQVLAEKVVREGVYGEYEVDIGEQVYDDARSTFKSAKETKSNKGKYTALLAILIVGSFVIPMAQYWWYVKDDDSTDRFFAQNVPEPEEPKKKGWF